jgi:hypothetical protein
MGYESIEQVERLRAAGFRIKTPLPEEYAEVIRALSDEEVDLLIGMKERLDAAEENTSPEVGSYSDYFLHPPF